MDWTPVAVAGSCRALRHEGWEWELGAGPRVSTEPETPEAQVNGLDLWRCIRPHIRSVSCCGKPRTGRWDWPHDRWPEQISLPPGCLSDSQTPNSHQYFHSCTLNLSHPPPGNISHLPLGPWNCRPNHPEDWRPSNFIPITHKPHVRNHRRWLPNFQAFYQLLRLPLRISLGQWPPVIDWSLRSRN